MSESLHRKIDQLSDDEAEDCLNVLLKGLTIDKPEYAELLVSPDDMKKVIEKAAKEGSISVTTVREIENPKQRAEAIRFILKGLADHPQFGSEVEAAIDNARDKLIEPVTTALVLGGIIFVLSLDVDVKYENKGGKKDVSIKIKKKPTSDSLLGKFFGLFS